MISVRYHIVSIAAVFLALAVGVVLGSTALSGNLMSGLASDKQQLGKQVDSLQTSNNQLRARVAGDDAFAGAVGPKVIGGTLSKRTVILISNYDVPPAQRDAVKKLIGQAGAKVTGDVQLTEAFSDPMKADQEDEISTRLQPSGAKFPTAGGPGTLAGALLGKTLVLDKKTAKPQALKDEQSAAISGLTDGGFIKTSGKLAAGQLAVVLTGGKPGGDSVGDKSATIARFATQLDKSGAGAVLAGSGSSAGIGGPVGVARSDTATTDALSTVDNVDSKSGQVATVMALKEQLDGSSGQYGNAGNANGPAPGVKNASK